jgi:hypothetical protein
LAIAEPFNPAGRGPFLPGARLRRRRRAATTIPGPWGRDLRLRPEGA